MSFVFNKEDYVDKAIAFPEKYAIKDPTYRTIWAADRELYLVSKNYMFMVFLQAHGR